jgi:hypothetical protein
MQRRARGTVSKNQAMGNSNPIIAPTPLYLAGYIALTSRKS